MVIGTPTFEILRGGGARSRGEAGKWFDENYRALRAAVGKARARRNPKPKVKRKTKRPINVAGLKSGKPRGDGVAADALPHSRVSS